MNRQVLAEDLNGLLAAESRGLAHHLHTATPYLNADTYRAWRDVKRMLETSGAHARRLSGQLESLELPERPASFAATVANYHYSDLVHLLPLLIEEKRRLVAAYERALQHIGDEPAAAAVVASLRDMLDENQSQVQALEDIHRRACAGTAGAERG